ncbi:MAG: site-specific DNA-methyltransferase [Ignavibacteriaceae bacterium]|nr:site-specific DNA-methyltransferase [Ignavibacteriaceae bacterium]
MAKKGKNTYIDFGERGRYNSKNKLNDLTGKEWIKFSKSWFVHRPPRRKEDELLHPAKFPETLIEEFISFFMKKNQWVLDPFMGTGTTLISAGKLGMNAVGVELSKDYFDAAVRRIKKQNYHSHLLPLLGSAEDLCSLVKLNFNENILFDYVITSPPYWNQLERNSLRQKIRLKKGLATKYSENVKDLGNVQDYSAFIQKQAEIFDIVFKLTKPNGYLTIITNNVYSGGKLYPLAYDTAVSLTNRGDRSWILKDEKIWLQDDKPLVALGVNNAWVANRHHQYCLIFRKETNKI